MMPGRMAPSFIHFHLCVKTIVARSTCEASPAVLASGARQVGITLAWTCDLQPFVTVTVTVPCPFDFKLVLTIVRMLGSLCLALESCFESVFEQGSWFLPQRRQGGIAKLGFRALSAVVGTGFCALALGAEWPFMMPKLARDNKAFATVAETPGTEGPGTVTISAALP
ncbi:uncharacterized protein JN550_011027 [Neoarthrinium moseri]|uniref:uncharacterized protein n=1 Tax=Neoarthrinium moseri TaxID=1658444 RepID=UPI001FDDD4D5|nr:uncharacterized protein JN550_011027 [Neoarthrinium moseri]KAI1861205.1 hypothetical protein JN550_011027 [Neoarthrinium moseri]